MVTIKQNKYAPIKTKARKIRLHLAERNQKIIHEKRRV